MVTGNALVCFVVVGCIGYVCVCVYTMKFCELCIFDGVGRPFYRSLSVIFLKQIRRPYFRQNLPRDLTIDQKTFGQLLFCLSEDAHLFILLNFPCLLCLPLHAILLLLVNRRQYTINMRKTYYIC